MAITGMGLAASAAAAVFVYQVWFTPAPVPDQLEYIPAETASTPNRLAQATRSQSSSTSSVGAQVTPSADGTIRYDFSGETVGASPQSFAPVVGNWVLGAEGSNKVLVVDGRSWKQGQTAAGLADRARALYGERYAEFLDNVQAFAYFPYAVATGIEDFRDGEITLRFKGIAGRIDQAMGVLFNLKPNGDYLTIRANPLEDNLVLWKFEKGKRSSVKWIRNTPTPSRQWHELKVVIRGRTVEGYLNGKRHLTHELPAPVSGRIGLWSKADSVVYVDDVVVKPSP